MPDSTTAILFDLDGTLTDPLEGIAKSLCDALGRMGRPVPDWTAMGWCVGPPITDGIATLLETEDAALVALCLQLFRERFSTVGLFENQPYPLIDKALGDLRTEGHRLFVATSKPQVFAQRILEHFGLAGFFHAIYGSEMDGRLAHKGDLIAHMVEQESLCTNLTLMVGDRAYDVVGAHQNSIRCLGVAYGYGSLDELREAGADGICPHPTMLAESVRVLMDTR